MTNFEMKLKKKYSSKDLLKYRKMCKKKNE